ncbi:MAG: hypothetical protein KGJ02_03445 [Verrucomicrobiota bacterium]|nr:hypothetical protein [Verrucomicrobiota bacterium]
MTIICDLKRTLRPVDLALAAARKRQSPRTGFVHFFRGNDEVKDTIPLYENGCFILSLFAQKKAETILEGKDLLDRLLAFQTSEGNFPIYLHDFPRCYDPHLGLKLAPLWLRLLNDFSSVLGPELKAKLETSLQNMFAFAARRTLSPIWEFRYRVCARLPAEPLDTSHFSPTDWWEYWISLQFLETPRTSFFHPDLQAYLGPTYGDAQDHFEPAATFLEWMTPSPRSVNDHPSQLQLSALQTLEFDPPDVPGWHLISEETFALTVAPSSDANSAYEHAFRLLWGQELHSLVLPTNHATISSTGWETVVELPLEVDEDPFEVALYCDARLTYSIDGKKGTVFTFGQEISLGDFALTFTLLEGQGDFCGHVLRGNRPCQSTAAQYESCDWKIGLRTLRRSTACRISVRISKKY